MTKIRDLPLSALRALKTAALTSSLTRAAEELGVTPGAVSHQIRQLEERLGIKLIRRVGNGIVLTHAAERALPDITRGFDALTTGMSRLRSERRAETFTISADTSFASQWLAPHLNRVRAVLPNLDVRIVSPVPLDTMIEEAVDLAISYANEIPDSLVSQEFSSERVIPSCAPKLIQHKDKTDQAEILNTLPLLHIDPSMGDNVYPTWHDWFKAAGLQTEGHDQGSRFGLTVMVAQAAITGEGVLLCSEMVIRDYLERGDLVEVAQNGPDLTIQRRLVWPNQGPKADQAALAAAELISIAQEEFVTQ
ncbi:LysR substrate-binding domain-containing protein [Kiloniella sp.]|uniref:LysR substrate-binding domain-containing protein n=1 Tax=Kiloniella sp. TaxID=1938587 RepID=UPI003B027E29